MAVGGDEDFADVNASHEELEAVAVFGDAEATLNQGADLERKVVGVDVEGSGVAADGGGLAQANRTVKSRKAKTQMAVVLLRCLLLINRGLRRPAGRRRPPVNGGR